MTEKPMCCVEFRLFAAIFLLFAKQVLSELSVYDKCSSEEFQRQFPCGPGGDFQEFPVPGGTTCIFLGPPDCPLSSSYTEARSLCRVSYAADLVRINNGTLNKLVNANLTPYKNGYYIGLERPLDSTEFHWVGLHEKATWFNWAPNEPKQERNSKQCVYIDPKDGLWRTSQCEEKRSFICERFSARNTGTPQLSVDSLYGNSVFYVGQTHVIQCSAHVMRDDPPLFFSATDRLQDSLKAAHKNHQPRLEEEERSFTRLGNRCVLRAKIYFNIIISVDMTNSMLSCCLRRNDTFETCSPPLVLTQVQFLPEPPIIESNILDGGVHIGESMKVKCSAFVGTGGQLVWSLETVLGTRQWKVEMDGQVYIKEKSNKWVHYIKDIPNLPVTFSKIVNSSDSPTSGPFLEAMFQYEVNGILEGATVNCRSYNPNNERINTEHLVKSSNKLKVLRKKLTGKGAVLAQWIMLLALTVIFILMTLGACLKVHLPRKYRQKLRVRSLMTVVSRLSFGKDWHRHETASPSNSSRVKYLSSSKRSNTSASKQKVEFKVSSNKHVATKE